jgi:predicted DsbA family dithiol-disulfide isomerase
LPLSARSAILGPMLIEIFADVICPWSYIGRARLGRALERRPDLDVDVRWQPFQLNPAMPAEGMERSSYLIGKFGSLERVRSLDHAVREAAEADGLPLRLDRARHTPNTTDAHRLIRLAEREGRGWAMADTAMRAYFVEGADLGDRAVLAGLAAETGFDPKAIRKQLDGDAEIATVRASDLLARQLGLHAVPCFVFDRRFVISGAQDPACFLALLAVEPAVRAMPEGTHAERA